MWDERYATEDYLFGTEPAAFLTANAELLQPDLRALAVADGEGRNSVFLAKRGLQVTAMDGSEIGVAKSRSLAADAGVTIDHRVADVLTWDWEPDAFDLVVAIFIQFVGPVERAAVFDGMKRTVRPGGRLLLHGYRPEQIANGTGGPPIPENMYTEDLLRDAFGNFNIEQLKSYDAVIEEGTGHVGQSALIDLVATKPNA